MRNFVTFLILLAFATGYSQAPTCPNNQIYIHSGSNINFQNVPLPGASGIIMGGLPAGSGGLAVGPAFAFPAPNPTYWTTAGGTYWYYNGAGWTNTGHNTGNGAAVNIGGGGGFLYNLVGGTGQVYVYNGTGNGTLLTTLVGFSGGGPYDVVCDAAGNFFILKNTAVQSLSMYGPNGVLKCSWSLANNPTSSAGGGFAIVGNKVYYHNGSFYAGNIIPGSSVISFTAQAAITSPSDFASCPVPIPTGTVLAPGGGTLNCSVTQLNLVAQVIPGGIGFATNAVPASSLASCNYTWSGPGIIAGQSTATITVNAPGVYSFTTCAGGACPSYSITNSYTVVGQGSLITPTITAPACFSPGAQISVTPNSPTNTINWTGPGITGGQGTATISINASGLYSVAITNTANACAGTGTVMVNQTPTVTIASSNSTLCSQGLNASPNTVTVSATGATSYTWTSNAGANFTANNTAGPFNFPSAGSPAPNTYTISVTGSNGSCTNSAVTSLTVLPNPVISVTSGTVCQGNSITLTANGASTYTWSPGTGLNTTNGSSVNASPNQTTVYSVIGSSMGCNSATQNSTVGIGASNTPTITAPACINGTAQISVMPNTTTNTINWSGPGIISGQGTATININAAGLYSVTVPNTSNACAGVGTVFVNQTPTVSIALSNNTLCSQPLNGSPATITVSASGAISYTWTSNAGANFTPNNTAGPFNFPSAGIPPPNNYTIGVTGSNGVCSNTASASFIVLPNPVLTVSNGSMCSGTSTTLTATGASAYTWSPGTGLNTTTGSMVIANPNQSMIYSVIGTSLGCNSATQNSNLTVVPNPTITLSPASPTICAGSSINLSGAGANTYNWAPSTGLSSSVGSNVSASPPSTQEYTVVGTSNTCTHSAIITVTVIPVPVLITSSTTNTICAGYSANLTVTGAGNYSWSPSTGLNTAFGGFVTATPGVTTIYTIIGNNGLCTGTATLPVYVVPLPDVNISTPNPFICNGSSVTIYASGAQNFTWSPANTLSSGSGAQVVASPSVSTNYTIVGYNSLGDVTCSEMHSYSIVVIPNAEANVSPNSAICLGNETALTVSGGDTYTWTPSEGLNFTYGSQVIATPSVTTVYTVHSSYDGNCGTAGTVMVTVNPLPVVNAGRDTTFNVDAYKSIKATGTGTLYWTEGDEIWCRVCPETQIMPVRTNCYTIRAENEFGCVATDEVCVFITEDYGVYIPNAITPNGDGINDIFYVYGYSITNVHINIFDRWGEKLFTSPDQTVGWPGTFKGADCPNDVYIYKIDYKAPDGKRYYKTGHVTITR